MELITYWKCSQLVQQVLQVEKVTTIVIIKMLIFCMQSGTVWDLQHCTVSANTWWIRSIFFYENIEIDTIIDLGDCIQHCIQHSEIFRFNILGVLVPFWSSISEKTVFACCVIDGCNILVGIQEEIHEFTKATVNYLSRSLKLTNLMGRKTMS